MEWLSSDTETQRLYEAREHSLIEKNSLIAEGKAEGKAEVVLAMLKRGMDAILINELTGCSMEEIERIARQTL